VAGRSYLFALRCRLWWRDRSLSIFLRCHIKNLF
jgi:hypothetical protein